MAFGFERLRAPAREAVEQCVMTMLEIFIRHFDNETTTPSLESFLHCLISLL